MPRNKVMINAVSPQLSWELFVDRATTQKGLGIGIVIIFPERITLEKSLRLGFSATNNEAEFESFLARLNTIKMLGGKVVKLYCDSRLIAGQVRGNFKVKDLRMQWYLNQVK